MKRKLKNNKRIVLRFLFFPKTLMNEKRKGFVKILQYYQYDFGYSSGVYKGWHWEDICFED